MQKVLTSLPIPATFNGTSGGGSAQQTISTPAVADQFLGRADYQLTASHMLSYMQFHHHGYQSTTQMIVTFSGDLYTDTQDNIVGADTWTISPSMLNVFTGYYTFDNYASNDLYPGQNTLAQLGITSPPGANPATQPNIRIAGFFTLGNGGTAPNTFAQKSYGFFDNANWNHGAHTVKFGGSVARNNFRADAVGQRAGIYTVAKGFSGNNLADLLLGKSTKFNQNNSPGSDTHVLQPALYAQDDWRIGRNLTVNLGVRWEVYQPYHGSNNTGTFTPNVQSTKVSTAPLGVLFAGDPGVPDGILNVKYTRFAPRIGFAYDLFGNGSTSIRGGYGLFYSQVAAVFYNALISSLYSVGVSISNTTNFTNPYSGSATPVSPFPFTPNLTNPTFNTGITFGGLPPGDSSIPYVTEYNMTLERQLSRNWGLSISYVGNNSRKLIVDLDQNAPVYSSTCTTATCGSAAQQLARRPYKPAGTSYVFNAIYEYAPSATANYNSLQTNITHRLSHNFTVKASYVWFKNLTDAQDPTSAAMAAVSTSNNYNIKADYGKAPYDVRHNFVASYLWISPNIQRFGYVGKELLSGWHLNGITTLSTGQPFSVLSGSDTNFDGYANDRANVTGNPSLPGGRTRAQKAAQYFNIAAFTVPAVGAQDGLGNSQNDMLVGPGTVNTDLAAAKSFAVWRASTMQFRADAFDVFSNVNLPAPTAQVGSPLNGVITGSAGRRILQLSLKYDF